MIKNRKEAVKSSAKQFEVKERAKLLEFLYGAFADKSRTTVKSYLTHRQVSVNNIVCTNFAAPLTPGDKVSVSGSKGYAEFKHPMLRIVYEDDSIVVIDKKYGLLSIATDKVSEKTAYHILSEYVKRSDPRNMIFVLHRLDRETSGLMMFAKNQQVQKQIQENWNEQVADRKYYAVVEGRFDQKEGVITSYLAENKAFKVYSTDAENGRIAITNYKVMAEKEAFSLLELELETGRKNQIRAQLEETGHSICGDKKYGAASNPLGRVALHAGRLAFIHPATGETLSFDSPLPYKFRELFDIR